jgi:two-component system, cell cycle response regulator
VDDSLVIRKAIEKKLQNDFDLVMAGDGEAGWDMLLQGEVRVLITDIEMPRLDGCALIRRIRASADPRLRDIPIIAMTGAEDEETKERVLASGATDFVVKPIDPMQLLARVHSLSRLDLTTRQLAESQAALKDQSTLDPLTGLSSRRYFQQNCQQNLAYAVRHSQGLALIRMEIDGFKSIYRQHGDDLVDQLLVWLADIFATTCRREDTVARIGGAAFAVMAPATNQDKALALCRRLCDAVLAQAFVSGAVQISVTLSVGTVTSEEGVAGSYEDLMGIVERRTRAARFAGGNRVVAAEEAGSLIVEELSLNALQDVSVPTAQPDEVIPASPELAAETGFSIVEELSLETPQDVPASMVLPDGGLMPELSELSELSELVEMSGLEFDLDTTPNDPVAAAPLPDQSGIADGLEFVGLDAALLRLAKGEGDSIEPWLDSIVRRLLPLLEFYSDRREGVLAEGIANIKARCLEQS